MLEKLPLDKINVAKNWLAFLLRVPSHHSFIFNLRFLYELKNKAHFSKTMYPSGSVDVECTSIEHPYRTCGRQKATFNGLLMDVPNETQLVRPNRTKTDVHFRPSKDVMHGIWTSSGPPPDVHYTSTGRPLDVIFDWHGAWTSF